jgi:hypothetical protein
MTKSKLFCLQCLKEGCVCSTNEFQFKIDYRLKVPVTKKKINKALWRKFIDEHPNFFNTIRPTQVNMLRSFLETIKYEKELIVLKKIAV